MSKFLRALSRSGWTTKSEAMTHAELDGTLLALEDQIQAAAGASTESVTLYVSAAGSDANDGLSAGAPFQTWAKVHDTIPDLMRHAYEVRIIGSLAEPIYVEGKRAVYGRDDWRLTIGGDTDVAADHAVTACYVSGSTHVSVNYLQINGETRVLQSAGVRFHFCKPRNTGGNAIRYNYSTGAVQDCDFGSGVNLAAIYSFVSTVWSSRNSGSCTGPALVTAGGVITCGEEQPTGTPTPVHHHEGGVIAGSPGARVIGPSGWTQSITSGTFTDVNFGSSAVAVYDPDGWWSSAAPARLTVPPNGGGLYVISASIRWSSGGTVSRERYISVRSGPSGATVERASSQMYPAVSEAHVQAITSGPVMLTPGNHIEVRVRQKSGSTLSLTYADQSSPVIAVHRVA